MTVATRVQKNEIVHISGRPGSVFARVIHCDDAANMPELPNPAPPARQVREILAEGGVEQVVLIGWFQAGRAVCCVVMGDGAGHWKDLQRQDVYVRALTPAESARVENLVPPEGDETN